MKTLIAIFMMLILITASGCRNTSNQGGIAPVYKEFSITVPSSITVKQGQIEVITVSLNRGADFKQDVQLDIETNGISVTPRRVLVKASDMPDTKIKINVDKGTALGNYLVSVKGTPTDGLATSIVCTIRVVPQ